MKQLKETTKARTNAYKAISSDVLNNVCKSCTYYSEKFKTNIPSDCLNVLKESVENGFPINVDEWIDIIQQRRKNPNSEFKGELVETEAVNIHVPIDINEIECFLCACNKVADHLINIIATLENYLDNTENKD